jgi:hypothetical protein
MPADSPALPQGQIPPRALRCGRAMLCGILLACSIGLPACTHFPEMGDRMTKAEERQKFPKLVPVETLLAGTEAVALQPDTQETLDDRVAALNRRADGLRAAGMDDDTRDRMQRGVILGGE